MAFTGSTEVGKLILQAATNDLKKVSLELGGKSPNVVLRDADLDLAVKGTASAIFFNHGQCCCAGSRLFVQESIFDKLVGGVADEAKKIKVGPGLDPKTQMGPMVSESQFNRVCGYLESGLAEGAKAVAGGGKLGGKGYFVERSRGPAGAGFRCEMPSDTCLLSCSDGDTDDFFTFSDQQYQG